VSAGDPNDASARDCASERLCSSRYWDSQLTRMRELWMIPRHCGCDDQLARTIDVVRAMSPDDTDSERRQIFSRAWVGIASRNSDPASSDQLGERAHSSAGDSDEMNRALVGAID
jgi:hypothetical protein